MTQKNKKIISQYDHPDQFLPLLPAEHVAGPLYEKASQLIKQATHLSALPTSGKRALRPLLRKNLAKTQTLLESNAWLWLTLKLRSCASSGQSSN
jgi:hypothetical protein